MDRLDIRILRELYQAHTVWPARPGVIASYREVARRLEANPGTVRNRIARMIKTGFLRGVMFYINPSLLGLHGCSYAVELAPGTAKPEVLRRVVAVEGVVFLENFRGPLLGLGIVYDTEASMRATMAKVDRIAGGAGGICTLVEHPPAPNSLSRPEWTLALRLMSGNVRSFRQLADEMRMPVRTLRRRLEKLGETGALLTFPELDYRAVSGSFGAELVVGLGDPALRAEAESRIMVIAGDWTTFVGAWAKFNVYRMFLPRVGLVNEMAEEIGRIPGVLFARAELVDGLEDHLDKIARYAEQALAAVEVTAPRAAMPPLAARLRVGR
ncbi:MAG: winged helix-turn-helix transcriptional regulator [Thermoplasmata archaeon]|nr:winged helix-turn-helix transcriptional regulator [Thermoplasmata archaeon]